MDLELHGRRALVCGASRGLGKACALALAREGVAVTIAARSVDAVAQAADEIRRLSGTAVTEAVADITTQAGRAVALAACPEPDILVTNAGGPPLLGFEAIVEEQWNAALNANMLAPIALIRAVHSGMRSRKFGRIINITSALIKAPIELLSLSSGARLGLTGAVASLAREGAADNVTINNLLPDMFETDRFRQSMVAMAQRANRTPDDVRDTMLKEVPARRLGDPNEFGAVCAFLCSVHAGYITGQNLLIDGGHFRGLF